MKPSNSVDVTVVIPAHNSERFLARTLDSIKAQSFQNYECIVVDDASTDNTVEVFREVRENNKRLKLIKHKVNTHVSGARNSGIRASEGRFICFLDSDDLLMPDSLEVRFRAASNGVARSDKYAGSYCASARIEEDAILPPPSRDVDLHPMGFLTSNGNCPFNANQPMIRADLLRQFGGFNEKLSQGEDYDLWMRLLRAGYWFAPAKRVAVTYRYRSGSLVRSHPIQHLQNSLAIYDSSHRALGCDELSWSRHRYIKSFSSYRKQSLKLNRVLKFVGMQIAASGERQFDELHSIVENHVPDLFRFTAPGFRPENQMEVGRCRQLNLTVQSPSQEILRFCERLRDRLHCINNRPVDWETDVRSGDSNAWNGSQIARLWKGFEKSSRKVVFLPHKDYHVWTIALIANELKEREIDFSVIDLSPQWREAGVRRMAQEYSLPLVGLSDLMIGFQKPDLIVTFNDWDPVTRPILIAAQHAGIRTCSIVEGIQDYLDSDTQQTREAYLSTDSVILPGEYDKRFFDLRSIQKLYIGGIPRIEKMRNEDVPEVSTNTVLINSNFSYGVLVEHRDDWLRAAVNSVLAAGMTPLISRHPGDKGSLYPEYVSNDDFYTCLRNSEATIQRFASGVIEAIAWRKPTIYFNPHGEKVRKFQEDPMNAYSVITTTEDLESALQDISVLRKMVIDNGPAFLDAHAGKGDESVAARTVDALCCELEFGKNSGDFDLFQALMKYVDQDTMALTRTSVRDRIHFNSIGLSRNYFAQKLKFLTEDEVHILRKVEHEPEVASIKPHASSYSALFPVEIWQWDGHAWGMAIASNANLVYVRAPHVYLAALAKDGATAGEAIETWCAAVDDALAHLQTAPEACALVMIGASLPAETKFPDALAGRMGPHAPDRLPDVTEWDISVPALQLAAAIVDRAPQIAERLELLAAVAVAQPGSQPVPPDEDALKQVLSLTRDSRKLAEIETTELPRLAQARDDDATTVRLLHAQIAQLRATLDDFDRRGEAEMKAMQRRNTTQAESHRAAMTALNKELREVRQRLYGKEQDVLHILGSRSWRLTRPLRVMARIVTRSPALPKHDLRR